ncbi:MAG: glycosyltransferase family 1 protein [Bdellovibrionota bacterium]
MRIAIDARAVQPKLQGMGRHVLNLLLGFSCLESDLEFLVIYSNPLARKLVERSGGAFRSRFQWIKSVSMPGNILEEVEIPWLLKVNKADLFHDVGTSGVWTAQVPVVTTIHELAALRFDESPPVEWLKRLFKRSRLIVTVSQSLADEVEANFNISRPKIRVITNAVDPWYAERVNEKEIEAMRERFRLRGKYFLCVTSEKTNKNIQLVFKAAAQWRESEQWVFTISRKDEGNLRHLGVVEDVWLRPLYAASEALIVPSLYEGFSLPPIEALAIGSIPVVSDILPHREVLKDILPDSLFFDPTAVESLSRALSAVSEGGEPLRRSVLEKFRLVSDRYSFKARAEQVQAVYREALRG